MAAGVWGAWGASTRRRQGVKWVRLALCICILAEADGSSVTGDVPPAVVASVLSSACNPPSITPNSAYTLLACC